MSSKSNKSRIGTILAAVAIVLIGYIFVNSADSGYKSTDTYRATSYTSSGSRGTKSSAYYAPRSTSASQTKTSSRSSSGSDSGSGKAGGSSSGGGHYASSSSTGYASGGSGSGGSSNSEKDDDPYDANEYVHPDDFYYDHYDDFVDFEDAEDYYYSHGGK